MDSERESIGSRMRKVEEEGGINRMEKRGRGRPRKSASHNIVEERMNKKVTYSDNLPEFFKIYLHEIHSKMVAIPPDFIDKFGGNVPSTCTLKKSSGVCWQVVMKRVDGRWFFEKGWPEFVKENSLNDHDVVLFSLVSNSTFSVKIFSSNGCIKGGRAEDTSSSDDETSESEDSDVEEAANEQIVRGRRMGAVGEINGKPGFSVRILRTHVEKGILYVPMGFWCKFVKKDGASWEEVSLRVRNKAWSVGLVTKHEDRVILGRGYFKFLRENSLQLGNLCIFQLISTKPLSFQVHIHK